MDKQFLKEKTRKEKAIDISSLPSFHIFSFLSLVLFLLSLSAAIFLLNLQTLYQQHAAASGGIDYYVSPSGSDKNLGTQNAPFQTITKAVSVAITPGTTVHVAPGTYTESTLTVSQSGTATAPITFISDTPLGAKIADTSWHAWNITGSYITLKDFEVYMINPGSASDIVEIHGNNESVVGNYLHDLDNSSGAPCYGGGAVDVYEGTGVQVVGNRIVHAGPATACNQMHGIYSGNMYSYIANNIISDVSGYGIQIWPEGSNSKVVNNDVANARTGGIIVGAEVGHSIDFLYVANNIVRGGYWGIRECCTSSGTLGTHMTYTNNDVIESGAGGAYYFVPGTGSIAQNPFSVDPQYVNWQTNGSGDYHLQATSPMIDKVASTGTPSTDFAGNPRPQGNGYDIGAYEYVFPTPTPTPTATPTSTSTPIATPFLYLIQNGSFESTGSNWLSPWGFQSSGIATIYQASQRKVDGAHSARVNITKSSPANNAVQLYQRNISLTLGKSYTFVFWARASMSRTIGVDVRHGAFPWTLYFSQSVTLTTSWQQYTLAFTAPQTDANGLLDFNLANATGYVWIDNVSLR